MKKSKKVVVDFSEEKKTEEFWTTEMTEACFIQQPKAPTTRATSTRPLNYTKKFHASRTRPFGNKFR